MCEDCRKTARELITALVTDDKEHPVMEMMEGMMNMAMQDGRVERIQEYAREHDVPEEEIPSEEEIRENTRDCLIAAQIAVAAAVMASRTTGYTAEGGEPPSIVLGMWAGEVMSMEAQRISSISSEANMIRHLFGMGNN